MAGEEILVNYEGLKKIIDLFSLEAEKSEQMISKLTQQVEALHGVGFKGKASDTFHGEMESLVFPGLKRLENAMWFGQNSLREIVQVFQQAEEDAVSEINVSEEQPVYQNFIKEAFVDYFKSMKRSVNVMRLIQKWRNADDKEKLVMLNEFQKMLSHEYNYQTVPIKIIELVDPEGRDWGGYFDSDKMEIVIDKDNLENDSPAELFEILAHENRHVIQLYYVDHPDQAHPSISSEQIHEWGDNLKPGIYISGEDNFEGYWKQPIEADARQFAESTLSDFLEEGKGLNTILNLK